MRNLNVLTRKIDALEAARPPADTLLAMSDDELRQSIADLEAEIRRDYGDAAIDEDPALKELAEFIERLEREAKQSEPE